MDWLLSIEMELRLGVIFVLGTCFGAAANLAINRWAWWSHTVSPWSVGPAEAAARTWRDRLPVVGWLRLRREAGFHSVGFWVRPLCIELCFAAALTGLYWWEVGQLGLIVGQVSLQSTSALLVPSWVPHATFLSHTLLLWLMVVASFIDIDEKIIPDEVTVLGTLVGLVLVTLVPMSLLPNVSGPLADPPQVGVLLNAVSNLPGPVAGHLFVEPTTAVAPLAWPPILEARPNGGSLAIGLASYWLWCFALVPRIWRGHRGPMVALGLIGRRVTRELTRPPLMILALGGSILIPCGWAVGGGLWIGMLTGLIGLAGSGGIVWAVRIVSSGALGREAMGFGDVTLMMMIGTLLGWQACLIVFFLAPLAGILVGLLQLAVRKDDVIPYGPFLCLAALAVIVLWVPIWSWAEPIFQMGWIVPIALGVCLLLLALLLGVWARIKRRLFLQE
jgi:leader peptidase (prepilin peptidase)/N-methyltransferase